MVDVNANAAKALARGLNLTGRLRHAQIRQLTEAWFPQIRFHEKERFHPIDLETLITAPAVLFANLPESAKDSFRIDGSGPFGATRFDPPVIKDGSQVVGHGATAADALDDSVIGTDSVYTHGDNLRASHEFFGASTTVSGAPDAEPGDPRVPRHPIVVRAELRYLLEALKHELQADTPADALWGRFAIEDSFFVHSGQALLDFSDGMKRAALTALIDAYERHDDTAWNNAIAAIPHGWSFVPRAWNALKGYVFLQYYFMYAYNDYPEYGQEPFVNEHEGDAEGCCVVFERESLQRFADGVIGLADVTAHTVITSVHGESDGIDELKRLPVEHDLALHDLVVYVAPGSHATYLTAGTHDILSFDNILIEWPGHLPAWALVLIALSGMTEAMAALLLLTAIFEHFAGAEDQTSDFGASVGPGPPPPPGGTRFDKQVIVTPLSKIDEPGRDLNLYQAALQHPPSSPDVTLVDLVRRAFPGKWGATSGIADYSGPWDNETARYFRDFMSRGDIPSEIIL